MSRTDQRGGSGAADQRRRRKAVSSNIPGSRRHYRSEFGCPTGDFQLTETVVIKVGVGWMIYAGPHAQK